MRLLYSKFTLSLGRPSIALCLSVQSSPRCLRHPDRLLGARLDIINFDLFRPRVTVPKEDPVHARASGKQCNSRAQLTQ